MSLPNAQMPFSENTRSHTGRLWQFSNAFWREAAALTQSAGLHPTVAHILAHRGINNASTATTLLNPRLENLPDPMELKDMETAVTRLHTALVSHEKLAIFGDYDVDGTCATALLARYFRAIGNTPILYIPHRITEGYGPTPAAMQEIAKRGAKVVITVDTGTTAHAAMEEAKNLGLSTIITDHHQPEEKLPPTTALLNPMRADDTSPLQGLCGSGVAFYLLLALNRHLRKEGYFQKNNLNEPNLLKLLDLVALATVADVMPLTGPNRILVARGLMQMGTWQNRGLAMLAEVGGLKTAPDTYAAGFVLGPRLNAAGRVDSAEAALNLLMEDDDIKATPYAHTLNTLNNQRREMEKQATAEALAEAEKQGWQNTPVLVLAGNWHPGIVGIVAARVKEHTHRAVFVLGRGEDGTLKGSGRSVPALNLGQAVHACQNLLISGGGHAMAAGLSLKEENLPAFREALTTALLNQLTSAGLPTSNLTETLTPALIIDAALTPASITGNLLENLQRMAPFGPSFPEPTLALTNTVIAFTRSVGSTQEHLKLRLTDTSRTTMVDAMAFGANKSPLGPALSNTAGRPLTVAGNLRQNSWNGATTLDFHLTDAHPAFHP